MNIDWRGIRRLFSSRRVRALEEDVERLREENRALVNSILGIAGMPPMPRRTARDIGAVKTEPLTEDGQGAVALRRRSWQQRGRWLEIEDARAARRERETDTDVFPAPRDVVPRI